MWINKVAYLSIVDQETLVKGIFGMVNIRVDEWTPRYSCGNTHKWGFTDRFWVNGGDRICPMTYDLCFTNEELLWTISGWMKYGFVTQTSLGYMARVFFFFFFHDFSKFSIFFIELDLEVSLFIIYYLFWVLFCFVF